MPIYAYKCESCGFAKDVLQKISDAPLNTCPNCNQQSFAKQVTAAGFQLKGSGWYATDFRGGGSSSKAAPTDASSDSAKNSGAESTDSKAVTPAATPSANP